MVILITGCDKSSKLTCSINNENIPKQTFIYTVNEDVVDHLKIELEYNAKLLGYDSFENLNDDQKKEIQNNILKTLGLTKTQYDGINISLNIKDKVYMNIDIDIKIAEYAILNKLGIDISKIKNKDINNVTKVMEDLGATCK